MDGGVGNRERVAVTAEETEVGLEVVGWEEAMAAAREEEVTAVGVLWAEVG